MKYRIVSLLPTAPTLAVLFLFPTGLSVLGNSLGNTQLQHDTWNQIQFVMSVSIPNCKKAKLIGTEIIEPISGGVYKHGNITHGKWRESWTVDACGKTLKYEVVYVADTSGTSISVVFTKEPQIN